MPEVQEAADYVGDSLDLSLAAKNSNADRIIFAGVRFMAETAKILNPKAEVVLLDANSSCSLVKETNIKKLKKWLSKYPEHTHVSYINSSVEHKAMSDWIVTSRNARSIIDTLINKGEQVIFSPDYNMGTYFNKIFDWDMPLWKATCEVHKKFIVPDLSDNSLLIAHPESGMNVLNAASLVGSTSNLLDFIKLFEGNPLTIIYIATEEGILYNMKKLRPDLQIVQCPSNHGFLPFRAKQCECNSCPYMKLNTLKKLNLTLEGKSGIIININEEMRKKALIPLTRMMEFKL